jgi:hypothetical protein
MMGLAGEVGGEESLYCIYLLWTNSFVISANVDTCADIMPCSLSHCLLSNWGIPWYSEVAFVQA